MRDTGTEVRVWPDARYFESPNYNLAELERLLRAKAVLLKGVQVSLSRPAKKTEQMQPEHEIRSWHYPDGLRGYLNDLLAEAEPAVPVFAAEKLHPVPATTISAPARAPLLRSPGWKTAPAVAKAMST